MAEYLIRWKRYLGHNSDDVHRQDTCAEWKQGISMHCAEVKMKYDMKGQALPSEGA